MKIRHFLYCCSGAILIAAAAGCAAVREARQVQSATAAKGADDALPTAPARVDLSGCPLRALVDFAMHNRPSMVSSALAVRDARLALQAVAADAPIASATPWNALRAGVSTGHAASSDHDHFDRLEWTRRGQTSASLSVDLLIWDFGRNRANLRAKAEQVVAAEQSCIQQGFSVFNEVASTYFTLLQNEALLEVAHTNVFENAEFLRQAELRFECGEAKELDVLKARYDLAKAEENVVAASNEVVVAGADLMAAIGVDAATGDFRTVLGEHRPARLDCALKVFASSSDDAGAIFAFARTNAPTMRIARAALRAAAADVDRAIADLQPELSASLSLNWLDPLWYWRWSVNAVQNLFAGFGHQTALRRASLALERAATDVDRSEQVLSRDLALAVAARDNSVEARRTARSSVARARENLDNVKAQYEVGEVSRVEYTDAVGDYIDALGSRVKAFYQGQAAEAAIFEAAGIDPVYGEEVWVKEER